MLSFFQRWVGGKRQQSGKIVSLIKESGWGSDSTYYEPFTGSGAVYFELQPTQAVLNDYNPLVAHTYRCVRDQPLGVDYNLTYLQNNHSLELYQSSSKACYCPLNSQNRLNVQDAARLIYLVSTSFNGMIRFNRGGGFNAPIGRKSVRGVPARLCPIRPFAYTQKMKLDSLQERLFLCSSQLSRSICASADFERLFKDYPPKSGDLVYFDPPYLGGFTEYTPQGFSLQDHVRLADLCKELHSQGVRCIISEASNDLIRSLYIDKHWVLRDASRKGTISSKKGKREEVGEFLITNF